MKQTAAFVLTCAVSALLASCSASDIASAVGQQATPPKGSPPSRCAALLVRAVTSPSTVVHGAWVCQDADLQKRATAAGIMTDADLESLAQSPPVYSHAVLRGQLPDGNGWEWTATLDTGSATSTGHIIVWTDPDGKVSNLAFG